MSTKAYEDLLYTKTTEPRILERRRVMAEMVLQAFPERAEQLVKEGMEKGLEKGRLLEARAALHRVLARRQLALTAEQAAGIQQCTDPATLERWLEQAVTAATTAEALQ